jgi:hypothetical protein
MADSNDSKVVEHLKAAEILLKSPYMEPQQGALDNRDVRDAHISIAQVYATLALKDEVARGHL